MRSKLRTNDVYWRHSRLQVSKLATKDSTNDRTYATSFETKD
ncbi:MAG: hypothetical protein ACTS43_00275 [Candidatus Hodgkinia cicadicola]